MPKPTHLRNDVTVYYSDTRKMWRITWPDPATGNRTSRWRTSEHEAFDLAHDKSDELGQTSVRTDITYQPGRPFAALVADYRNPTLRDNQWSDHYKAGIDAMLRAHVWPHLPDDAPAADVLTEEGCRRLLNIARDQAGLADTTRANLYSLLSGLTTMGRKRGYISPNAAPLADITNPRRGAGRKQGERSQQVDPALIPDWQQIEDLGEAMRKVTGDWWRPLQARLNATCGYRLGEMLAAEAADIDLAEGTAEVLRQASICKGKITVKLPKGDKERVTIFDSGNDLLVADLERRIAEVDGGLLFPAKRGGFDRSFNGTVLTPARQMLGWERKPGSDRFLWNWHSLRHYFCTWALASPPDGLGLEVADVTYFAGHANEAFTWTAYVSRRDGATSRARAAANARRR